MAVKFEKELDCPLKSFLSLIYETSKYPKWFPFNKQSILLAQPGKAKKLIYLDNNIPVISNRDFLIYGFGVNKFESEKVINCVVSSIDKIGFFKDLVDMQKRTKNVRGEINIFGWEVKIINSERLYIRGVMDIDPKLDFIPTFIVNVIGKEFAKNIFAIMIKIVKNYEGSEYQNKNPSSLDKQFYDFVEEEIKKLELPTTTLKID